MAILVSVFFKKIPIFTLSERKTLGRVFISRYYWMSGVQRYFKASSQQKKPKILKSIEYFFNFSRSSAHAWAAPPPPSGPARPAGTAVKGTKTGSRRIWRREEEDRTIGRGGTEEKRRTRRKRARATEVSEGWPSYISRILENTFNILPELFRKGIWNRKGYVMYCVVLLI